MYSSQQFYTEAVDHKAHNWELLQNLRGERILNGIEHLDSLNVSNSLSQSLLSLNSLSARRNGKILTASNDSLLFNFGSTPPERPRLTRTLSGETRARMYSSHGQLDLSATLPLWMERTSSLNTLREEMPETGASSLVVDSRSPSPEEKEVRTFPRFRSQSIDTATQTEMCQTSIADLFKLRHTPISDDDSSTDSDIPNEGISLLSPSEPETILEEESVRNGTPTKRNSTGSTSNTKSLCPSSEQKIKSILRISRPRCDSDTANFSSTPTPIVSPTPVLTPHPHTILPAAVLTPHPHTILPAAVLTPHPHTILPAAVLTPHPHTILPAGTGSPSSEDSDMTTNSPLPKMEVVQCHTTEALSEVQTSMSVQAWAGEFNVTYVDSRPHEDETTKPKDEEQEVTSADANESGSLAELEKGFTAFPPNCEPQSKQLTSEKLASVSEKSSGTDVAKQSTPIPGKSSQSHKVMFSSDTKCSSPDPKRKNRSVGSISTSGSATTASSVKGSSSKPKQSAPKQGSKPDPRRHSLPAFDHSTRIEMQKSRLFGTKVNITPAHRRVTGKSVRELSQLYEASSGSSKPTTKSTGTRSVSSRSPHSVSTKPARDPKVGAQATSKLRAETSNGSIPSQANSLSKRRDTDKRKAPAHSRSFSQPAQPLSKPVQLGVDPTHRKQRTKSEILRAPLQGILKRRPNGAVNATSSGTCSSTQTECVNLNSNNNSLSLPSRRSRIPIVRFSEGQNSSCLHQAPTYNMYGHCDKKTPAEWALSWSYSDPMSHKLVSSRDKGVEGDGQSYLTQVTVVVPPQH